MNEIKIIRWGLMLMCTITLLGAKPPKQSLHFKDRTKIISSASAPENRLSLWYSKPATYWEEAMPIGNGRLGAMVYGGVQDELIQLNEESVWAGPPYPENKKNIEKETAEIRALLFEGQYTVAQEKQAALMPERIAPRSYQTMGNLRLSFQKQGAAENYRRDLNLDTAVTSVQYEVNGTQYKRELFSTAVDQVMAMKVSTTQPGSIHFTAILERPGIYKVSPMGDHTLVGEGQASHEGKTHLGVKFATVMKVVNTGGTVESTAEGLKVEGADEVVLYIAANTDYNRNETQKPYTHDLVALGEAQIEKVEQKGYVEVKQDAITDYRELFDRVSFRLGGESSKLNTLKRLAAYKKGAPDVALEELYFHYGRYLLISCSREGCLPANLQGIWNWREAAPWNSDYHININFQMNYWPAELTNLSECHLPMLDYVERLVPAGQQLAQNLYGCRGFMNGHVSDVWHFASLFGRPQYGQWVLGGAWCTQHFMEHYRYTLDREFLEERAYPILKQASLFFIDWLVEEPGTGLLVSGPSTSPENRLIDPSNGKPTNISMGPAMDQQVIWDTLSNTLEAATILGIDDSFTKEAQETLANLAMPKIGSDGRLMEWRKEYKEDDPGHRHISHLFGLYPGRQYNVDDDPAYFDAARKSIDTRLANGGGHTGWSRAWIINFWARFKEAELAHNNVRKLLIKSTYPNFFDRHPPFQIDGNFGGTAGIAEMLVQSHTDYIDLLPALPQAWPDGEVRGLCLRGGFEIDLKWSGGQLEQVKLVSKHGQPCQVRYRGQVIRLETEPGGSYDLGAQLMQSAR